MVDLTRLSAGVDPAFWQEHDCVSFPVERLPGARVLWLNRRWWLAEGYNVDLAVQRREIEEELLTTFGVRSSMHKSDSSAALLCDRYGSSFGSCHGGSGRSGISGRLMAKGIGRTPLAGPAQNLWHVDGYLSLGEAIREIVAGEIADAELPWGAVPGVALLVTGKPADDGYAILVRPSFLRPAHFERSLFFGNSGTPTSDQYLESLHVRSIIARASDPTSVIGFPGLLTMFNRFADQIGASHAHRLWQGKFLSSNATIYGALADFGSFRTVPSWNQFVGLPDETFGGEPAYLDIAFQSLVKSFGRHGEIPPQDEISNVRTGLREQTQRAFGAGVITALGLERAPPSTRSAVIALFQSYFRHQQCTRLPIRNISDYSLPWIHSILTDIKSSSFDEERLISCFLEVCASDESLKSETLLWRLANWTCPRTSMSYEGSADALDALAVGADKEADGGVCLIRQTIDLMLAESWRDPAIPSNIKIRCQGASDGTVVSYGTTDQGGTSVAVVSTNLLDTASRINNSSNLRVESHRRISRTVLCDRKTSAFGGQVVIEGKTVSVPPASFHYPKLASRWRANTEI